LDKLDLVHMNGRIYDPLVARFMSADPIIQDPMHSQSYNRYTYVWNNPTNLTDPTGFVAAGRASSSQQMQCSQQVGCQVAQDGSLNYFGYDDEGNWVQTGSSNEQGTSNTRDNTNKNPLSKTYFIGGASDYKYEYWNGPTGIMKGVWEQFKANAPDGATSDYYDYENRTGMVADIIEYKRANPEAKINLVGHSRGGAAAIQMAISELAKVNLRVNMLIAIDPVHTTVSRSDKIPKESIPNVTFAIVLNAEPKKSNGSDSLASFGGKFGVDGKKFANIYAPLNSNHDAAWGLLHGTIGYTLGYEGDITKLPPLIPVNAWDLLRRSVNRND
jgi:RHS repeat-associated protein